MPILYWSQKLHWKHFWTVSVNIHRLRKITTFVGNFNLKNKLLLTLCQKILIFLSPSTSRRVDRQSPKEIFNAIFMMSAVLALLWKNFFQISLTPWKTYYLLWMHFVQEDSNKWVAFSWFIATLLFGPFIHGWHWF